MKWKINQHRALAYDFLRKHGGDWYSANQILLKINSVLDVPIVPRTMRMALLGLYEENIIERIEIHPDYKYRFLKVHQDLDRALTEIWSCAAARL